MFFTVKQPIRIAGKTYLPCICYNSRRFMDSTIEALANEGKARIHEKYVYFQNGKLIECGEAEKKVKRVHRAPKEKVEVIDLTVQGTGEGDEGF